jgi:hypothetical protein
MVVLSGTNRQYTHKADAGKVHSYGPVVFADARGLHLVKVVHRSSSVLILRHAYVLGDVGSRYEATAGVYVGETGDADVAGNVHF